jgi:NodT family efflux transporter outer membrane factor (OMF) lipoprotein
MEMKHVTPGVLLLTVLSLLVSCSTEQVTRKPTVDLPDAFSASGNEQTPDRWWKAFEDRKLNRLVQTSLSDNMDVKTAWDRLAQSMAVAKQEGADLYPRVDGSFQYARDVTESGSGGGGTIVGGSLVGGGTGGRRYSDEYSLNLNASYEVDVWGRVRAASEAAEQDLLASREDVYATALSVSAQVTDVWYRLVEQRAQLDLINDQIETNENYLDLVQTRFQRGAVSSSDILQQQNLVTATQTEKRRVKAEIARLRHQLAVLQGSVPEQVSIPSRSSLPELAPRPETGIPSQWIRKRPDIRRAYRQVKSADRELASAIASRFPRINITPQFRADAAIPSNLLETWSARLATGVSYPLFNAGELKAGQELAKAEKFEQIHQYTSTVLTGIREVEDALSSEVQQKKRVEDLRAQIERSGRTVDLLLEQYRNGTTHYLRVLDEIRNRQQLQRDLLAARGQLVRTRIALYEALGGSWDLPLPDNVPEPLQEPYGTPAG